MEGYIHHYQQAKEEFILKFYNKHNPRHDWFTTLRSMSMELEEIIALDDEAKYALESFEDCQQVRIIYNYDVGQHCLKIKWEHSAWWSDDLLHSYYCVMLPIDQVKLLHPHELITEGLDV